MESERIVRWSIEYLNKIAEFREDHKNIVYLDETWFDTHDIKIKGVSGGSRKCVMNVPSRRGKRVIILHAGGANGWLKNGLLISVKNSKDSNADYHENMSAALFEEWMQHQLFPNLPEGSIIVMDNAPSHSRLAEKIPNSSTRKADIVSFIRNKNIDIPESAKTRKDLLGIVSKYNFSKTYAVEELAKSHGFQILRLPPYFCIFNPIELIWSQLKRKVRKCNDHPESSPKVVELIRAKVETISPEVWRNCINHVESIEQTFRTTPT
ncbi:hypothetical protein Zmor_015214 [Zophobas morio]|uniref:Tc1-like transposase DDE domain-containing protein n=1 Tax=Zophobas morio TaxID=2755281 RepID=A0AA38IIZ4_9CUCU|nr:hypothetical protein Zmor_015214 [Zophobas morio]